MLSIISVTLSAVWVIASEDNYSATEILLTAVTHGVLIAGTRIYMNQLYFQVKKDN